MLVGLRQNPYAIGGWRGKFATKLCYHGKRDFTAGWQWWRTEGDTSLTGDHSWFPSVNNFSETFGSVNALGSVNFGNQYLEAYLRPSYCIPAIICPTGSTASTQTEMGYITPNFVVGINRTISGAQSFYYFKNSLNNKIDSTGKYRLAHGYVMPTIRTTLDN